MSQAFLEKIEAEIKRRSLLKHEFYVMWSEGKLTREHLAGYSLEYFQLVKSVPLIVKKIIAASIAASAYSENYRENLLDEISHVDLWKGFALSLGITNAELASYGGANTTRDAISMLELASESSFLEAVAAMYAFEKEIPEISRTKMDGLARHYGINSPDAIEYFRVHEKDDVRHAAIWRRTLESTPAAMESAVFSAVERSLEAQNRLLDSVMDRYVRT